MKILHCYIYPWLQSEGVGIGDGDVPEAGQQVDYPGVELHLVAVVQQDGHSVGGRNLMLGSQPVSMELQGLTT